MHIWVFVCVPRCAIHHHYRCDCTWPHMTRGWHVICDKRITLVSHFMWFVASCKKKYLNPAQDQNVQTLINLIVSVSQPKSFSHLLLSWLKKQKSRIFSFLPNFPRVTSCPKRTCTRTVTSCDLRLASASHEKRELFFWLAGWSPENHTLFTTYFHRTASRCTLLFIWLVVSQISLIFPERIQKLPCFLYRDSALKLEGSSFLFSLLLSEVNKIGKTTNESRSP